MAKETARSANLREGLTNRSPSCYDESMKPPKGSVDSDTTRESTAKTPRTIGPREA